MIRTGSGLAQPPHLEEFEMRTLALLLTCCTYSVAVAQSPWQPSTEPSLDLKDSAIAKVVVENGNKVVALRIPEWKTDTRKRQNTETRTRTETRTKQNADGTTEDYSVEVPFTVTIVENYAVQIPSGKYQPRVSIPLDKAHVWKVTGEKMTTPDIERALSKAAHVLLFMGYANTNYQADAYFASLLNPDILVVYYNPMLKYLRTAPGQVLELP